MGVLRIACIMAFGLRLVHRMSRFSPAYWSFGCFVVDTVDVLDGSPNLECLVYTEHAKPLIDYGSTVTMPLSESFRDTGERINILTVDNPRTLFQRGEVVCPCGEPYSSGWLNATGAFLAFWRRVHLRFLSISRKARSTCSSKSIFGANLKSISQNTPPARRSLNSHTTKSNRIADIAFRFLADGMLPRDSAFSYHHRAYTGAHR